MIRCNLAVLLAEQNLKITKVSMDTGISRNTLTLLASNRSQGIQFETMNTLCLYLKTTPDKLFVFCPCDISLKDFSIEKNNSGTDIYYLNFEIYENKAYKRYQLLYGVLRSSSDFEINSFTINAYGPSDKLPGNPIEAASSIGTAFKERLSLLPTPFLTDLEDDIIEKVFPLYDKDSIVIEWNFGRPDYLPF